MTLAQEKILIIEDDASSRTAMADYLRRKKLPVVTAANGAEGLEFMDSGVAVVVTDLKMPTLDGMGVLRGVRARFPKAGVILVAAYGDIASAVEAMRLGATDYLTKPVNPDELHLKIRRIYDNRTQAAESLGLSVRTLQRKIIKFKLDF